MVPLGVRVVEWSPLDENALYDVRDGAGRTQVRGDN